MRLFIDLTPEEYRLAEKYAKCHSLSLENAFKSSLFEQIENEFDVAIAEDAYNDYLQNGQQSRPISELWSEISSLE